MFNVVFRKTRGQMGKYGNNDLLVWANAVHVEWEAKTDTQQGRHKVTCIQHSDNEEGTAGVGPVYYVYDKPEDGHWEHFFVKDVRNNQLVWSTGDNAKKND